MDIFKIAFIFISTFCLYSESQDTFTCQDARGEQRLEEIEAKKVCDFISDCENGKDEAQCGTFCTFEGGSCNWETDSSSRYTWAYGSGDLLAGQNNLGPAEDRSARNSSGGYFYVRKDGSGTAPYAELLGPALQNTAETCKFSFYYHLSESDAWKLEVFLQTNYTTIHLKDFGSDSTSWKKKFVTLGRVVGPSKIIFRASKVSESVDGAVAIDYISFKKETCFLAYGDEDTCGSTEWQCEAGGCIPESKLCDFVQHCRDESDEKPARCADRNRCDAEIDFCNITTSAPGGVEWQRLNASSVPADGSWPFTDHTYMSPEGHYFAVAGSSGDSNVYFIGPAFKGIIPGATECKMSLFYQLSGISSSVSVGFRTRYSRADNTPFTRSGSTRHAWKYIVFNFDSSADFMPLVVGEVEDGAVLAIDDIIFSEGCVYAEPEELTDRCTFENKSMPLCSWNQDDTGGSLQWKVFEARLAGKVDAINVDHTDQSIQGHYLYLPSQEGDEGLSARLVSSVYQPGECQMILWYYLGGSNTNKLSIYTRTALTEGALQLEWRESGDKGRVWREAAIRINQTSNFQIVVEGSAGAFTTHMDHIGIDDTGFNIPCTEAAEGVTLPYDKSYEGDCLEEKYSCTDGTCIISESGNCPMECNFDEGFCGWTSDVTAGSQWSLSESIPPYGPESDRTSQGQYIFVDGKGDTPYQDAVLVSPKWPLSNLDCTVSIWYYHFAYNYGSLALQVKSDEAATREVFILHSHESDFNKWKRIEADVPKCLSTFQILLKAQNSYGSLQHGGFAVDDFSLTCSRPTCSSEYQCSTGEQCFTPSEKCDLVVDCCQDRTDEEQCGGYNQCSFEEGFCIWQQDSTDGIEWSVHPERKKRHSHMEDGIPPNDGSFVQTEFEDRQKGKKTILHSSLISAITDDSCELRFVYFTESSTSLRILLRHDLDEGEAEQVWRSTLSGSWQKAVVSLSSEKPFEVVFEASSVSVDGGLLGIDSTSFTPSCSITDENLKPVSQGNGLTAVIIFIVGILICLALLIGVAVAVKGRKKEYHTGETEQPAGNHEEESSMI